MKQVVEAKIYVCKTQTFPVSSIPFYHVLVVCLLKVAQKGRHSRPLYPHWGKVCVCTHSQTHICFCHQAFSKEIC